MDFDATNKILYTGDEMGNMHKWDLSRLIDKLVAFDEKMKVRKSSQYGVREFKQTLLNLEPPEDERDSLKVNPKKVDISKHRSSKPEEESKTFLTASRVASVIPPEDGEDLKEDDGEKDVFLIARWKAHMDGITWVTFNETPTFIATSSFDKNVYIWNDN